MDHPFLSLNPTHSYSPQKQEHLDPIQEHQKTAGRICWTLKFLTIFSHLEGGDLYKLKRNTKGNFSGSQDE
jgi:hypothetical protein